MAKSKMDSVLEEVLIGEELTSNKNDFDDTVDKSRRKIETKFDTRFNNLDLDIKHVDDTLAHIKKYIFNMEAQIDNIKVLIKSEKNPGKKGHYYGLMNSAIEINARYEELYLKGLDLKHKYRKEQDDLNIKVSRMVEIDLVKAGIENTDDALSPGKLAKMISDLTTAISRNDDSAKQLTGSLLDLENDPEYSLD